MKYIALIFGKISAFFLMLLGKRAGSFPGKYSNKICPELIKNFKFPEKFILVTGTNGKSGVTKMIKSVFQKAGYTVISNDNGDNIINGLTTVGIKNSDLEFKIKADVVVLEIDELTLARNIKFLNASDIVITNFFEDQLDRVGETDNLVNKIAKSLESYDKNIYLNVDNIYSNILNSKLIKANVIRYSVSRNLASYDGLSHKEICPKCGDIIEYEYLQYDNVGRYSCKKCKFSSYQSDYIAEDINFEEKTFITDGYKYHFPIDAIYQIYNEMAVIALARENDINKNVIDDIISQKVENKGRMEIIDLRGGKVLLNLIKNTAGANEILRYISMDRKEKSIIFVLNNNRVDGFDTSWIWECNFEDIPNIKNIVTSGMMCNEAALRFKYMNRDINIFPIEDLDEATKKFINLDENLYAIMTYTAVEPFRKTLLENI